jgi:DNA-binding transcriptional ArsR family regulator/YHS domain-containing protein
MAEDTLPELPDTKIRSYVPITDPELVESFLDPIRRAILVALRYGAEDIDKVETTDEKIKADGTKIITTTIEEHKIKRFWMTVPEIVDNVRQYLPEVEVSKFNCYYHLPKLIDQGLVEEFSAKGEKDIKSKRGAYYRRTAKVFVVINSKMSGDVVQTYLKLFKDGLEIEMNQKKWQRIEDLLVRQVEIVDEAMEYLAMHLKEVDVESTALSDLLQGLAYIFLSDNEEFVKIQQEIKMAVLTPCCGASTDMERVCSYCGDPLNEETIVFRLIDGKNESFCSEDCANNFAKNCRST